MNTMSGFGAKQQVHEDPGLEGIWEKKKKIAKFETNIVIGNTGFPGINQNIVPYFSL